MVRSFVLIAVILLTQPARAETLRGHAIVVDGDTLRMAGQMIRLHGVDAAERHSIEGQRATRFLRTLTRAGPIECDGESHDPYGRLVARCFAAGVDLGAALVADGYARAYRHFSLDYLPQEDSARALGLGIWSSPSTRTPQQRCHIKGNISGAGQIYHRPGDPYYRSTHIDHNRGERWFCSVADAQSAGWRAPRNAKPR